MPHASFNQDSAQQRLAALRALGESVKGGAPETEEVNNHVHSDYSFSPYSPTAIAVRAAEAGLRTVGIMDHDSVAGCAEFLEACKAINIAGTAGFEMRVNMDGTAVAGRKTNNPDESNISYIAVHGIPATRLSAMQEYLEPFRAARRARSREEVARLNELLAARGAPVLDFDTDVVPISRAAEGGTITERHILYALSLKVIDCCGNKEALVRFIEFEMGLSLSDSQRALLLDADNPHRGYDLLGVFKSQFVAEFFVQSGNDECPSVVDAVLVANEAGAIPAYAYLGDVGESATGDKKAEKFEDDFLDELMPELVRIGFRAVTYMPPRNTREQLARVQRLCRQHGLMEISGVDINSSRQSFNCPILLEPGFRHLADAAWALIAHEKLAAADPRLALFRADNPLASRTLDERIAEYARVGKNMNHTRPEASIDLTDDWT